jgi:hypothetical protein
LTTGVILFRGTLLINSACVIRTSAARALGGNNPAIEVYEDVEFFTRAIRRFGHVFVDLPVLRYSTGLQSIMHDLHWERAVMDASHRRIHQAYKDTWGQANYRLLQTVSKLLPLEPPPAATARRVEEPPAVRTPPPPAVLRLVTPAPTPEAPSANRAKIASGGGAD